MTSISTSQTLASKHVASVLADGPEVAKMVLASLSGIFGAPASPPAAAPAPQDSKDPPKASKVSPSPSASDASASASGKRKVDKTMSPSDFWKNFVTNKKAMAVLVSFFKNYPILENNKWASVLSLLVHGSQTVNRSSFFDFKAIPGVDANDFSSVILALVKHAPGPDSADSTETETPTKFDIPTIYNIVAQYFTFLLEKAAAKEHPDLLTSDKQIQAFVKAHIKKANKEIGQFDSVTKKFGANFIESKFPTNRDLCNYIVDEDYDTTYFEHVMQHLINSILKSLFGGLEFSAEKDLAALLDAANHPCSEHDEIKKFISPFVDAEDHETRTPLLNYLTWDFVNFCFGQKMLLDAPLFLDNAPTIVEKIVKTVADADEDDLFGEATEGLEGTAVDPDTENSEKADKTSDETAVDPDTEKADETSDVPPPGQMKKRSHAEVDETPEEEETEEPAEKPTKRARRTSSRKTKKGQ